MKRFFAAITLFVLFAAVFPVSAYAVTFTVGSGGTVSPGDTVTVPVNVSNNSGFNAVGLVLTYDPDVLEIRSVTAPVAAMPLNSQFVLTTTPGTQWIHLINTDLADWNGSGSVANVTFNVKPNAPAGTSLIRVSFTTDPNGTPANANGTLVSVAEVVSGNVTVVASEVPVITPTPTPIVPVPTPIPTAPPQSSQPVKLPQTGLPFYPIPLLAVSCSLLIAGAVLLHKKRK